MTAPWWESEALAWDTESTGVDVQTDRVVTIALVRLGNGKPTRESYLINPGVEIPAAATAVHGITTEHAKANGCAPADALDTAADALASAMSRGIPVIGMNCPYDFTLFHFDCLRHDVRTLSERLGGHDKLRPVVDIYCLDKQVSWRKGSRKLTDLCAFYGVKHHGAHDSAYDALASAMVAAKLVAGHQKASVMSLDELHDAQVGWKAEQNTSYQQYRDSQRPEGTPDPNPVQFGWPLYDVATAVAS